MTRDEKKSSIDHKDKIWVEDHRSDQFMARWCHMISAVSGLRFETTAMSIVLAKIILLVFQDFQ